MAVLPSSGVVVLSDKRQNLSRFSTSAFQQLKPFAPKLPPFNGMTSVTLDGEEMLALNYDGFQEIKLFSLSNEKSTVAWRTREMDIFPTAICEAESGKLWVLSRTGCLLELKWSNRVFSETGVRYQVLVQNSPNLSMCYLPAPHKAFAVCDALSSSPTVQVISQSGRRLWRTESHTRQKAVTFSEKHQLLLVTDLSSNCILGLSPRDGSLLKSFPLPLGVGQPVQIGWSGDQLILLSHAPQGSTTSLLSLNSLTPVSRDRK